VEDSQAKGKPWFSTRSGGMSLARSFKAGIEEIFSLPSRQRRLNLSTVADATKALWLMRNPSLERLG